jgi:hypothetical protein
MCATKSNGSWFEENWHISTQPSTSSGPKGKQLKIIVPHHVSDAISKLEELKKQCL